MRFAGFGKFTFKLTGKFDRKVSKNKKKKTERKDDEGCREKRESDRTTIGQKGGKNKDEQRITKLESETNFAYGLGKYEKRHTVKSTIRLEYLSD